MTCNILHLAVFLSFAGVASTQLMCYYGTSTVQNGHFYPNYQPMSCPASYYCQKNYQESGSNYQVSSYGCGVNCYKSGCIFYGNGYGTCCCTGNYCNTGSDFSKAAFSSIVLAAVFAFFVYF